MYTIYTILNMYKGVMYTQYTCIFFIYVYNNECYTFSRTKEAIKARGLYTIKFAKFLTVAQFSERQKQVR